MVYITKVIYHTLAIYHTEITCYISFFLLNSNTKLLETSQGFDLKL